MEYERREFGSQTWEPETEERLRRVLRNCWEDAGLMMDMLKSGEVVHTNIAEYRKKPE